MDSQQLARALPGTNPNIKKEKKKCWLALTPGLRDTNWTKYHMGANKPQARLG